MRRERAAAASRKFGTLRLAALSLILFAFFLIGSACASSSDEGGALAESNAAVLETEGGAARRKSADDAPGLDLERKDDKKDVPGKSEGKNDAPVDSETIGNNTDINVVENETIAEKDKESIVSAEQEEEACDPENEKEVRENELRDGEVEAAAETVVIASDSDSDEDEEGDVADAGRFDRAGDDYAEDADPAPVLVTLTPDEYREKMLNTDDERSNNYAAGEDERGRGSGISGSVQPTGKKRNSNNDVAEIPLSSRFNYASLDAGAIVMASNAEAERAWTLLNEDEDKYSISPCEARKWVVIGLSEDIQVDSVVIANYERYSSTVRAFQLLGSHSYPVKNWMLLGEFEAEEKQGEQLFRLPKKASVRYLKFRFMTHYGEEFFCTLSLIRVYGATMLESLREDLVDSDQEVRMVLEKLDAKPDASSGSVPKQQPDIVVSSSAETERKNKNDGPGKDAKREGIVGDETSESEDKKVVHGSAPHRDEKGDGEGGGDSDSTPVQNDETTENDDDSGASHDDSVDKDESDSKGEPPLRGGNVDAVDSMAASESDGRKNESPAETNESKEQGKESVADGAEPCTGNINATGAADSAVSKVGTQAKTKTNGEGRRSPPKSWIRAIHVTILSSCPDGYVMVAVDLNPGDSEAYVCYRPVAVNETSDVEKLPEKDKLAVVEILIKTITNASHATHLRLRVAANRSMSRTMEISNGTECPSAYISAGGDVRQGVQNGPRVQICFKVEKMPVVGALQVLDVVKDKRNSTSCAFVAALNHSICFVRVPDKKPAVSKPDADLVPANSKKKVPALSANKTKSSEKVPRSSSSSSSANEKKTSSSPSSGKAKTGSAAASPRSMDSIFKILTDRMKNMEIDLSVFKKYLEDLNEKYSAAFAAVNTDVKNKLENAEKRMTLGLEKTEKLLGATSEASKSQTAEVDAMIASLRAELARFKQEIEVLHESIIVTREDQIADLAIVTKTAEDILGMRSNITALSAKVGELQSSLMNAFLVIVVFAASAAFLLVSALVAWCALR